MGCCGKSKENLELPIPNDEQLIRVKSDFLEYVNRRNSGNMDQNSTLEFFNKVYEVQYVNNPKQIRRAVTNMDKMYYWFKNNPEQYPVKKVVKKIEKKEETKPVKKKRVYKKKSK